MWTTRTRFRVVYPPIFNARTKPPSLVLVKLTLVGRRGNCQFYLVEQLFATVDPSILVAIENDTEPIRERPGRITWIRR